MVRPTITFHSLERAKRVTAFLERHDYGPIRARLCAYRTASMSPYFELRDMTNRALQRTYEYEKSGEEEKLEVLLHLPVQINRQLGKEHHFLFAQLLRNAILTSGLQRLVEHNRSKNPALSMELKEQLDAAEARQEAIDEGSRLCGGADSAAHLHRLLGDEKFLVYVEGVLFGNEVEFLMSCAGHERLEACADLTQKSYSFQ
jgi:hypothetical protein